uniref:Uncharacterized protein n=1 Tax=Panagrolaimus sp. ES5 TaxID=591445 RepID=A0AC34FGD8_9BILA
MVKPIHLKKLYKTCKFFYVKYQLTLVGDVEIEMDGTIKSDASHWRKIKVPQNLDRIWLYGKLNDYHGNSEALSEFLTRCERINLEKIRFSAELTYEELKILTKSGDVWNLEKNANKDSDFEVKNPYATPYGTEELMEKFYHSVRVNLALCETFDNNFHGTFSVATFRIGRER